MADLSAVEGLFGSFSHYIYGAAFPDKPQGGRLGNFVRAVSAKGVAHHHLFLVSIPYKELDSEQYEQISLFCHAASIPSLNVMTNHYRENEAHYEVPYGISYEPLTLNFYGDTKLVIKALFDKWYHTITQSRTMPESSVKRNNRLRFMDDFTCDITVTILNRNEGKMYNVKLINAWPKSIGNIDLNSQNTDVISFPVQFVYERLEIMPDAAQSELNLKQDATKALTAGFPVNIFTSAQNTASDLMQNATGYADTQVRDAIKNAAMNVNFDVDEIRSRVPDISVDGLFRT